MPLRDLDHVICGSEFVLHSLRIWVFHPVTVGEELIVVLTGGEFHTGSIRSIFGLGHPVLLRFPVIEITCQKDLFGVGDGVADKDHLPVFFIMNNHVINTPLLIDDRGGIPLVTHEDTLPPPYPVMATTSPRRFFYGRIVAYGTASSWRHKSVPIQISSCVSVSMLRNGQVRSRQDQSPAPAGAVVLADHRVSQGEQTATFTFSVIVEKDRYHAIRRKILGVEWNIR